MDENSNLDATAAAGNATGNNATLDDSTATAEASTPVSVPGARRVGTNEESLEAVADPSSEGRPDPATTSSTTT